MIKTRNLTLNETAQELTVNDQISAPRTIAIQNTHASLNAYLGTSTVTTSSYGIRLKAGESLSIDISNTEKLYAVGDTGATLSVLIIED
jgi:hypothetical protein